MATRALRESRRAGTPDKNPAHRLADQRARDTAIYTLSSNAFPASRRANIFAMEGASSRYRAYTGRPIKSTLFQYDEAR